MNDAILKDLAITAELCGAELSDAASRILVAELEQYDPAAVHGALARCRRELHGRLTLPAILERLDDGRPGPEEAWAMLPKDEADSAVITAEMREAMGPALRLLAAGDHVAARVAFLEAYRRELGRARAERVPVSWFPTLGHDRAGRAGALLDAVRDGKLTQRQAIACGADAAEVAALPEPVRKLIGIAGGKR